MFPLGEWNQRTTAPDAEAYTHEAVKTTATAATVRVAVTNQPYSSDRTLGSEAGLTVRGGRST
jgi:hypothetical protein